MTTRYVSKTGDNSDGLTLATAYTTFDPAYTDCVNGDTVLFDDGVYTGEDISCGGATNYALIQKGISLFPINDYQVTFTSVHSSNLIRYHGDLSGLFCEFGKFKLRDGVSTPDSLLYFTHSGAGRLSALVSGTDFAGSKVASLYLNANRLNIEVVDIISNEDGAAFRETIRSLNSWIEGSFRMVRGQVSSSSKVNHFNSINITVGGHLDFCEIDGLNLDQVLESSPGELGGIIIANTDNVIIRNCRVKVRNGGSSNSGFSGIRTHCSDGALSSYNGLIENNIIEISCGGGTSFSIGDDKVDAGNGQVSGILRGCKVLGTEEWADSAGHGPSIFYAVDSQMYGNDTQLAGFGLILKESKNCIAYGNTISSAYRQGLYFKGSLDSGFYNNTIVLDIPIGRGLLADTDLTNTLNCVASNNIFRVTGSMSTRVIEVADNQDVVTVGNNYSISSTGATGTPACRYHGVDYATLGAYIAAQDITGTEDDPLMVDDGGNYKLQPGSPVAELGIPWWPQEGRRPLDVGGEPFPDIEMSVGANQSINTPSHPNSI